MWSSSRIYIRTTPVFTLIYDSNSLFNKAITMHLAGDTDLGLASKKLSTTESIINY